MTPSRRLQGIFLLTYLGFLGGGGRERGRAKRRLILRAASSLHTLRAFYPPTVFTNEINS
jgi:hypothetical protein